MSTLDFIVIKDPHFRFGFNRPEGRTNEFEKQIDAKIDFVIEYGRKHGVDKLVFTGDVLDKKDHEDWSLNKIRANTERIAKLGLQFEIMSICGNHDMPYSSRSYKNKSVMQYFNSIGLIQDISTTPYNQGDKVIFGIDYIYPEKDVLKEIAELNKRLKKRPKNSCSILVLHQHIVPFSEMSVDWLDFLRYEDLMEFENIDVFINGHIHKGFETTYYEKSNGRKTWFINPWNMTRLARDEHIKSGAHKPEFVHVEIDNDQNLTANHVEFPYVKSEDAFVWTEVEKAVESGNSINSFIQGLRELKEDEQENLNELPESIKVRIEHYLSRAANE